MEKDLIFYFNEGNDYYRNKEFDKAIKSYSKAIKLNQNYSTIYINLGIVYDELKQFDKAIESYNKATELVPNVASTYINLGIVYAKLKQFDKAIESYNKAIELDPNFASTYNNLAIAYDKLKQFDKAIENFNKAIELDPNFASTYNNLGIVYYELKQFDKAIISYKKAIEIDSNNVLTYNNLGIVFYEINQFDKAIESYKKAIELEPNFASIYNNLGIVYYEIEQFEKAYNNVNIYLYLSYKQENIGSLNFVIKIYEAYPQNIKFILDNFEIDIESLLTNPFESILSQNKDLELILSYIKRSKLFDERETMTIDAIFQYYMGGCVLSYIMFDEVIDSPENLPLSNQELYYRALCSKDIVINFNDDIEDCINSAIANGNIFETNNYYLGHLYLLNNDKENAIISFKKAIRFVYAKIMLAYCTEKSEEKQKYIEELNQLNLSELKLNDIFLIDEKEKIIKIDFENCFYYSECYDATLYLKTYFGLKIDSKNKTFREIFKLGDRTRDSILIGFYDIEIEDTLNEIKTAFNETFHKGLTNTDAEIEGKIRELSETPQDIFKKIETNIKDGEDAENELRTVIESFTLYSVKYYILLLKYYYLKGKINKDILFVLTLFLIRIVSKRDEKLLNDAINETSKNVIDIGKTVTSSLALKIIFGLFKNGIDKSNKYMKRADEYSKLYSEYPAFKNDLISFLKIEKNNLSDDEFKRKYALENYFMDNCL